MAKDGKDNESAKISAVPGNRVTRFSRVVRLASGVAGGMLAEGGRQWVKGNRPSTSELLLTPGNARRMVEQLSRLRGAAMKVGQLVSMDAGDLLPPELSDILASLRADAHSMPIKQLNGVLSESWGGNWPARVDRFSTKPVAAASIGQVHEAIALDGRRLAIKLQYPGVRKSIDSDVDNVATLLKMSRLIPADLDIKPLLTEAKAQLHSEADYLQEAEHLKHYGLLLGDSLHFALPVVDEELTTHTVLAMSFMEGDPIESLVDAPQHTRDRAAQLLMELFFRELFEFRRVQTDPNFANYLYCYRTERLVLLDFGATRVYSEEFADAYRNLFAAGMRADREAVYRHASEIGYFKDGLTDLQREAVLDLFIMATEPFRVVGAYDFAASDLPARLSEVGMALSMEQDYWHTPPADALFLHRKLGGLFMLASRLRARFDLGVLVERFL
jgi:predicted unusual protein kinase regulating ubiquinone biosynthesis (AarF/ABC1/UbiB family)